LRERIGSPLTIRFFVGAPFPPQLTTILPQIPATISWLRRYFFILRGVSHSDSESIAAMDNRLI